jgi:hypothetical protein
MKRIFTFAIALMSMFAMLQSASALVYTAEVPAGTFVCYIAGNFPAPMNWAPDAAGAKMTKVDSTHFTIDLPLADATMEYKYCSGPGWNYVEKQADGTELAANRKYAAGVTDVVIKWAMIYDPTVVALPKKVTIQLLASDSVQVCYLAGSFNKWAGPLDSTKMVRGTASGGVVDFSITLHVPDANTLQFNFCAGPGWDYAQKNPSGNFVYPAADASTAVVVSSFKKIYDQSLAGTVKITATVPAATDSIWIVGSFSLPNWSFDKAILGTKNLNGTFSFVVPNVVSFSYVCLNKRDWAYKELDPVDRTAAYPSDANASITVSAWKATGINEIQVANNRMYTENSKIVVEAVKSQISLFDIAGRRIQSENMNGTFTSKALKTGMYIVRVDGATRKMGVK